MSKNSSEKALFAQMIKLVIRVSLSIVFGTMLLLIYIPFSDSIDALFDPRPEQLTGSYENVSSDNSNQEKVVDGIHVATGMVYDENFSLVRGACTSCHSAKLVTQNRATRDGWKQMIRWMQATQNLPDLGKSEVKILDYLAKNYAPKDEGRRKGLDPSEIEWYTLQLD
jgi:hypothetical protein